MELPTGAVLSIYGAHLTRTPKRMVPTHIQPVGTKVLIEPYVGELFFTGSFKIPDTVGMAPLQGSVLAIGSRVKKVRTGARVVFGAGAGAEFDHEGHRFLILDEQELVCEID